MLSSVARFSAPGTCCGELVGESSKRADRPWNEGVFVKRVSTTDGFCFADLCGGSDAIRGAALAINLPSRVGNGEFSGDSEGKDVSDLSVVAVVGVVRAVDTAEEFFLLVRTVPDFWLRFDVAEVWEEVRCKTPSLLPSMVCAKKSCTPSPACRYSPHSFWSV